MEVVLCRRCGRPLRAEESRRNKIGKRCARMEELEKANSSPGKIEDELAFLKIEIKMLKRQINALKLTGVKSTEAIERIKQDIIPEASWEGKMKVAIKKELKSIFSDPDWKDKLLHSVDDVNEIREPPKIEEVN